MSEKLAAIEKHVAEIGTQANTTRAQIQAIDHFNDDVHNDVPNRCLGAAHSCPIATPHGSIARR